MKNAQVHYLRWAPPQLTDVEFRSLRRSIKNRGIAFHLQRFMRVPTKHVIESGVRWGNVRRFWGKVLVYPGVAVIGFLVAQFGQRLLTFRVSQTVGGTLFAVGAIGTVVFISSLIVTFFRYRAWLLSVRDTRAE